MLCNTSIDDTEKFQFFKGKYNLMSDELSDIDWDTLFENKNGKKCGIFSNPNFIIVWTIIYQKEGMITGL